MGSAWAGQHTAPCHTHVPLRMAYERECALLRHRPGTHVALQNRRGQWWYTPETSKGQHLDIRSLGIDRNNAHGTRSSKVRTFDEMICPERQANCDLGSLRRQKRGGKRASARLASTRRGHPGAG
eukprot:CAMPEP_0174375202 /NCGR_PEP_ID=MMETSP0811_2-20130205/113703_1 /TAXON_ID=73025 ORGANISM="Eutreptiella gymnastica-like, Strain CCMP1594" /NCGR_SAMPLE_ID=MMETSP0811_2 /ASSEMBLY_ACC=CAM_ASM_000667 /LENGTH=124 /DNA_ID=CAMNT_0015525213 /DNA_START=223 /DNA_END=594 /DNA_ORIENTATION=+